MKKLFIFLLSVAALTSCKKFLEQPPYNNVSLDDIFKDFEGARTTLAGMYDNLKSTNYYLRDFYVYADVTGGNIKYSRLTNPIHLQSYTFSRDAVNNDLRGFYEMAYRVIYSANNVLQYVDRAADANEFQRNRMLADAFAIRALAHFDLVRVFAQPYHFTADGSHPGIVLRTVNLPVTQPAPAVSTVRQVYEQIIRDLDTSVALYGRSVDIYPTGHAKTWLSADAVKALRSRVHLYRQDWAAVIAASTELITSGRYSLLSSVQYVTSWAGKNISSESIFELAYGNRTGGSLGDFYNPANTLNSQWAATNDLLNLYATGDVRGRNSLFVSQTTGGNTFYYTRKYQGTSDTANNIKIIRLSEVYLNRAEAYVQTGNLTGALSDLNQIRRRGNPTLANFSSTDPQVILDEILQERRRELAFEGHLFFDLARNKKALVRTDVNSPVTGFSYPNPLFAHPIPVIQ